VRDLYLAARARLKRLLGGGPTAENARLLMRRQSRRTTADRSGHRKQPPRGGWKPLRR